jgi:hypothetical protein
MPDESSLGDLGSVCVLDAKDMTVGQIIDHGSGRPLKIVKIHEDGKVLLQPLIGVEFLLFICNKMILKYYLLIAIVGLSMLGILFWLSR